MRQCANAAQGERLSMQHVLPRDARIGPRAKFRLLRLSTPLAARSVTLQAIPHFHCELETASLCCLSGREALSVTASFMGPRSHPDAART